MPAIRRTKGTPIRSASAAACLACFVLCAALPPRAISGETARVVEAVDGDTLRVRTEGESRTVRLIGIDAPERSHPSRPKEFLADEAARALASLCEGKTVLLERGDEEEDRHGRLLRYVRLQPPDGRLVNLEMIRLGYARVYRRFRFSREAEFSRAESEARGGDRGIWRDKGMAEVRWVRTRPGPAVEVLPLAGGRYAVVCAGMAKAGVGPEDLAKTVRNLLRWRTENSDADFTRKARQAGFVLLSAERPPEVAAAPSSASGLNGPEIVPWEEADRHVGSEVVVIGTLVRAHRSKNVLYLNFHPNWKKYVSIAILARDLPLFPRDAAGYYKGKTVRVRGEVTRYHGRTEIVVRSPEAITVLE